MIVWQRTVVIEDARHSLGLLNRDGPWTHEADEYFGVFKDPTTEHTFLTFAWRSTSLSLCGYVGITKEHPYYGRRYNTKEMMNLGVHGGLTFTGKLDMTDVKHSDKHWWLGFDCAHAFDYIPMLDIVIHGVPEDTFLPILQGNDPHSYKNIGFVTEQIDHLGQQLVKVAHKSNMGMFNG